MRVVVDNNIFISGLFWKGAPNKIIQLAEAGALEVFTTPEILEELFGVLGREKFKRLFETSRITPWEVFEKILGLVVVCLPQIEMEIIKEDPSDNKFLACALTVGAAFIVSGDNHLLKIKRFQNIRIVTPAAFLKFFKK